MVFDRLHLLGIPVVVCERLVHVREVEVQPLRDGLGTESPPLDALVNVEDGHPAPLNVRFVVDLRVVAGDDPMLPHCHTRP